jgi:hypothetical protein
LKNEKIYIRSCSYFIAYHSWGFIWWHYKRENGFLESFKAYGFICLPIAAVTYFAGLRANQGKAKYEVSNKLTKNKK